MSTFYRVGVGFRKLCDLFYDDLFRLNVERTFFSNRLKINYLLSSSTRDFLIAKKKLYMNKETNERIEKYPNN